MKKVALIVSSVIGALLIGALLVAWRSESRIPPNTYLGPINVGGSTPAEASAKLDAWWEAEGKKTLEVHVAGRVETYRVSVEALKVSLDRTASITQLPVNDLVDSARQMIGSETQKQRFPIKLSGFSLPASLRKSIEPKLAKKQPARVYYVKGELKRQPEMAGAMIDDSAVGPALEKSFETGTLTLPIVESPKTVTDEMLAQITEEESTFTTRFPTRKVDRNTNIKLASSAINGIVIPPSGRFSFNTTVGRRTIQNGYKEAPVFKNGKHDMGVGGGICQVSSTLYNAALFGDLKIVQRHNHSMPVPYLPVGRDATVDYGSLDLVIENNQATAVAISSELKAGTLTFRILGKKDPALSVKIVSANAQSWDPGLKKIVDPKLPAGKVKVIEKGTRGHSLLTYRVVYKNGVEVAREPLGRSYYKGGVRIVAVGAKPASPVIMVPGMPAVPPAGGGVELSGP